MTSSGYRAALDGWRWVLGGLAAVFFIGACYRLTLDGYISVFTPAQNLVSNDLMWRRTEAATWFSGAQVYGAIESADYPPASYALFYTLVGWGMSATAVRAVWTLTALLCVAWIAREYARAARGPLAGQLFLIGVVTAAYSMAAALRIGQVGIHAMAASVAATALLARRNRSTLQTGAATLLILVALVKPTFSAPFVWLLVALGGLGPAVSLVAGYVALTLFAAYFQQPALSELISRWLAQQGLVELVNAHGNVHSWLAMAGQGEWALTASLLILAGAGVFTFAAHRADPWVVFGILGVVARIWSYHRWYDDMLLLAPLMGLYRVAQSEPPESRRGHAAVVLMLAMSLICVAPATWLLPDESVPLAAIKTVTSLVTLAFLAAGVEYRSPWARARFVLFPSGARAS